MSISTLKNDKMKMPFWPNHAEYLGEPAPILEI